MASKYHKKDNNNVAIIKTQNKLREIKLSVTYHNDGRKSEPQLAITNIPRLILNDRQR